jgi:thiamine pyrophosphokinase
MRILLVGGGPVDPAQLAAELKAGPDLAIAVDGGGRSFLQFGIRPGLMLGDFDSLPDADRERLAAAGVETLTFPRAKDQTDLELAIDLALERGAGEIRILGGLGRRIDHTLGNIGLLGKALQRGVPARLLDPEHEIFVADRPFQLAAKPGWAVSLVPLTPQVRAVRTEGLRFPLRDEDLEFIRPRGLHNEFAAPTASVRFAAGTLLVILFAETADQTIPSS